MNVMIYFAKQTNVLSNIYSNPQQNTYALETYNFNEKKLLSLA